MKNKMTIFLLVIFFLTIQQWIVTFIYARDEDFNRSRNATVLSHRNREEI